LAIEWDVIIVEMSFLAGIIYFSVYLEHWAYMRSQKKEDERTKKNIIRFIENDLQQSLNFIDESLKHNDSKPFLTDMWMQLYWLVSTLFLHLNYFRACKDLILG